MKILFLDIETAPQIQHFKDMSEDGQTAFKKKVTSRIGLGADQYLNADSAYTEAALYAEFSRIICIGVGKIVDDNSIHLMGITGTEIEILNRLSNIIASYRPDTLCAHNGKGFDYPFLCRRYIVNKVPLPSLLNLEGKKPWEIVLLDTVEMWRFTDMRYYVSLITLAYLFDIPSPKNDMDGSQVPQAFFDGKIKEIEGYCLRDVETLINIYRCMRFQPKIVENIVYL